MHLSLFRHSLAREIALVLGIKFVILMLAAIFLFGARQRPHVDSDTVYQHLFSQWPK